MSLWEWFGSIPWWLRLSISGILILISTVFFFAGTFWPWGWAVGFVLLCFGGPSDSEKKRLPLLIPPDAESPPASAFKCVQYPGAI